MPVTNPAFQIARNKKQSMGRSGGEFYTECFLPPKGISREKSEGHSSPLNHLNRTVTPRRPRNADLRGREYLTPKEVDRLQDAARKHSRYGHCIALHKARHKLTSPGAKPWTRPLSAAWWPLALSSTAWPSLRPPATLTRGLPCVCTGLLTPHRLSSEGDTMNIRLPAATQSIHGRMELTVLQLAPRGSATCSAFLAELAPIGFGRLPG